MGIKDNDKECIANSTLVSLSAKRFPAGHWSFFGPGSETKWCSTYNDDQIQRKFSEPRVPLSQGLNKLVTNLIDKEYGDNEQETSETKTEVFALKIEVFACASRSQAKAKPSRPSTTCSSSRTVLILERTWIDIEPGAQFDQALFFGTENYLEKEMYAIEFWRLKDDRRNKFEYSQYWYDDVWKSKMAGGKHANISIQY